MPENIIEKKIQLLSINGATELATGNYVVGVNFGELIENTPEIASRIETSGISRLGPKQIGANTLTIFLKPEHAKPFSVGSNWKLTINNKGKIILEKEE